MKRPLNASVAGGFRWVEAVKGPNQTQVPGGGAWFFKHQKKEAIAEPPVPPVGIALQAYLESTSGWHFCRGKCYIAWSGRSVLSDITHPHRCLKHPSVAFSEGLKHLKWMKKKLLAIWQQCEQSPS